MRIELATFGVWELLVILLIVVVIFGAGKLPQLGDALGKSIRNFRKSFKGEAKEIEGQVRRLDEAEKPQQLPAAENAAIKEGEKAGVRVDPPQE
jgi:sec-independent protein translocase protein TatA